jgi:hypothetical protein
MTETEKKTLDLLVEYRKLMKTTGLKGSKKLRLHQVLEDFWRSADALVKERGDKP